MLSGGPKLRCAEFFRGPQKRFLRTPRAAGRHHGAVLDHELEVRPEGVPVREGAGHEEEVRRVVLAQRRRGVGPDRRAGDELGPATRLSGAGLGVPRTQIVVCFAIRPHSVILFARFRLTGSVNGAAKLHSAVQMRITTLSCGTVLVGGCRSVLN